MTTKKHIDKDVLRHSPLFMGLALCLALLLIITAFEWKFYDDNRFVELGSHDQTFEEILDIPITTQPPPPPPMKKVPPVIEELAEEEIEEEVEVVIDIEVTEEDVFEIFVASQPEEEEEIDQILTIAEEMPTPVGGYDAFYKFFAENVVYPPIAKKAGIEGRVILEITVNNEGKLSNAIVARGIGYGCDKEALRVMNLWKDWNPGKQRGKPRTIRMYVPLVFKFSGY